MPDYVTVKLEFSPAGWPRSREPFGLMCARRSEE